jgi:uncharacterized protein YggE
MLLVNIARTFTSAVAWAVAAAVLPVSAHNATSKGHLLHVTGAGRQDVSSSITAVSLAVQKNGARADDAQTATAKVVEDVLRALENADVRSLKTESMIVQPVFNYTETPPTILSYEGISTLSYKVRSDRVGRTLDVALQAGANRVDSVQNEVDDAKADGAYLRALEAAATDADRKAHRVSERLGICIRGPANVLVVPANQGHVGAADQAVAAVVAPGQFTVTALVHVAYTYGAERCTRSTATETTSTVTATNSATGDDE